MNQIVESFIKEYYVERKNTSSYKWDILKERFGNADLIGMWVADMDFKTPKCITDALTKRISHGTYGYSFVGDAFFDAFFKWQERRHQISLKKDWLRFSPGVVSAIYWAVNAYSKENESVMIITPVYYPFRNAILDNKRNLVKSEAVLEDGKYHLDFDDIEQKIIRNGVKLFIHCSPHNPIGRVWSEEELERLFSILHKHEVVIISDEIHQDIIPGDKKFISALNVANGEYIDDLIVMTSASKTFNLACLLHSSIIIPNEKIRQIYDRYTKTINQTEISVLGVVAAQAGYESGEEWLNGITEVIRYNYNFLKSEFKKHDLNIFVSELEGTYLTWIDLRNYIKPSDTKDFIQNRCNLAIDYGEWFSDECQGYIRINLATHPKFIELAANNIINAIKDLK